MSIRSTIATYVAVTITAGVGAANAATYDLYREHSNNWFGATNAVETQMTLSGTGTTYSRIGGYDINAVPTSGTDPVWNFVGWCVDLFTPLATDTDMYITTSETSTSEPARLTPDAASFDDVELLFRTVYDDSIAEDRILSAGFQLAIWELLYETGSTLNVMSGDFFASNFSGGKTSDADELAARVQANEYLALFQNPTEPLIDFDFVYFTSVDGIQRSQVLITPIPVATEVPLPAPALLLVGGLVALASFRRRQS